MKYPKPLQPGSTIGIFAPSAGVGHKTGSFDRSLAVLRSEGYKIIETASVRTDDARSASAEVRGRELSELIENPDVDLILCASGGDYNLEMLPYADLEGLAKKQCWLAGASDPTNLLYPLTTKYDIASIYGFNAGTFDWVPLHKFQKDSLRLLRGEMPTWHSFDFYDGSHDFSDETPSPDQPVCWISRTNGCDAPVYVSGRLIGGCLDCIAKLIGTPYDGTADFLRRYRGEPVIWFFDPFEMNADTLYLTMLQMKYCGYFEGTAAVIFGRIMFNDGSEDCDYLERLERIFDMPVIWNCDIGHVRPTFSLINGAGAEVHCEGGKGWIRMEKR